MLWQLLQSTWYQMYWLSIFLDFTSRTEKGILMFGRHSFSIDLPKLAPWRRHFSCIAIQEATRRMAVTGYESRLNWRRARCQESVQTVILIKAGKSSLLEPLHNLLLKCWKEGEVPQDMRGANIIPLYKNKGDRSDCNNYRDISLLSIVGKLFARIIPRRLQVLAERIYSESQCGFRSKRSTVDMIFSTPTTRKMSRTKSTTVPCFHCLD